MNPSTNNEVAPTQIDGSIITPTKPLLQVCLEYRARLDEKTNEAARLRELLDEAIEWLEDFVPDHHLQKLRAKYEAIKPTDK